MADTPNPNEVPVLNPSGEFVYIPADRLQDAIGRGYTPMSPEEVKYEGTKSELGGVGGMTAAALAGAARGISLGASDVALTKSGLVEPETLRALKEVNPVSSTLGDVAGSVFGAGKIKALGFIPGAGKAAQALIPAAAEGAGLASQVLRGAGRTALGSSVEGAIYGAGQAVSEAALEDKELTAEALASGVGFGMALGGGIGGVLGAGGAVLQKLLGKPGAEAAEAAIAKSGVEAPVDSVLERAGLAPSRVLGAAEDLATTPTALADALPVTTSPDLKSGILSGLGKTKKNAAEIKEAAEFFGAKVSDGMLSDSQLVQKAEQAIMTGPSMQGEQMRQPVIDGIRKISDTLERATGQGEKLSANTLGQAIKTETKKAMSGDFAAATELYDAIKPYEKAITLNQRSKNSVARNISAILKEDSLIKGTPEYQFVSTIAAGAKEIPDTLEGLYRFQTNVSNTARGMNNSSINYLAARISEKLDTMANTSVRSFAESMQTPQAKEKILSLLDKVDEADKFYAKTASKAEPFLKQFVGSRARFKGARSFNDAIDAILPEDFAKWAADRNNAGFQAFLEKEAPEAWRLVKENELKAFREKALVKGEFNPSRFLKEVEKLQPEYRHALFGKDMDQVFAKARTYLDALPPNFNPSGTASMSEFFQALTSPTKYMMAEGEAYLAGKIVKTLANAEDSKAFKVIKALEEKTKVYKKKIQDNSNAIFTVAPRIGTTTILKASQPDKGKSEEERQKEYEKAKKEVKDITTGGNAAFDRAEGAASGLYAVAPGVTDALQLTSMKAASFLASKLKENPEHPFVGKMPDSPAQINEFMRYYSVVKNPLSVLDQVKEGTITPQAIETLTYVYPKLYATMKTQVHESMIDYLGKKDKKKLPYKTQMAISAFLGVDLSPSFAPQAIADFQLSHAAPNRASDSQPINPTQGGMSKLTASDRMETPTQALAAGRYNA